MKTLNIKELKWVDKARGKHGCRSELAYGVMGCANGKAFLLATDTMRIHAICLGDSDPFDAIAVNLARIINEMEFTGNTELKIDTKSAHIGDNIDVSAMFYDPEAVSKLWGALEKFIPNYRWKLDSRTSPITEFFAINADYFADAVSNANYKKVYLSRFAVPTDPKWHPVLVLPEAGFEDWFAFVMPIISGVKDWCNL
jgi:hypothetical protein